MYNVHMVHKTTLQHTAPTLALVSSKSRNKQNEISEGIWCNWDRSQ